MRSWIYILAVIFSLELQTSFADSSLQSETYSDSQAANLQCESGQVLVFERVFYGSTQSNCETSSAFQSAITECFNKRQCTLDASYFQLDCPDETNQLELEYRCIESYLVVDVCDQSRVSDSFLYIHSPGYSNNYGGNVDCTTVVESSNSGISYYFIDLSVEPREGDDGCYDKVYVQQEGEAATLRTYCGQSATDINTGEPRDGTVAGSLSVKMITDGASHSRGFLLRIGTFDPCAANNLCSNNGDCYHDSSVTRAYSCDCNSGYDGEDCENVVEVDPCDNHNCVNGDCVADGTSYYCDCHNGWVGEYCAEDDPCLPNPCRNSGSCAERTRAPYYKCTCTGDWTGSTCNIRPCVPNPCDNEGACTPTTGDGFACDCASWWTGDTCTVDPCSPNPCKHGSCARRAVTVGDRFRCTCDEGWQGRLCWVAPAEACDSNPCYNGATCASTSETDYTCACTTGWKGKRCGAKHPCEPNPCKHTGVCTVSGSDFSCDCTSQWKGNTCQVAVSGNPCDADPCANGGSCVQTASSYTCSCVSGWIGDDCEDDDPCLPQPCKNSGACSLRNNGNYRCTCVGDWTGSTCTEEIVDMCEDDPCENEGVCTSTGTDYECDCPQEFVGKNCQNNATDADDCATDPCENGGTCEDDFNSYNCVCEDPFIGLNCEFTPENQCASYPCKNDGDCEDDFDSFYCHCTDTWKGEFCETSGASYVNTMTSYCLALFAVVTIQVFRQL